MLENNVTDLQGNLLPDPQIVVASIEYFNGLKKANTRDWDPIGHDFAVELTDARRMLFRILMAQARKNDIDFVSIAAQDLITPNYRNPTGPFDGKLFAWDISRFFGFSSCGNGKGDFCGQYQITGTQYFGEDRFGVWDPKTETLIHEKPFTLRTPGTLLFDFLKAMRKGNLEKFMDSDVVFRQLHIDYDHSVRF